MYLATFLLPRPPPYIGTLLHGGRGKFDIVSVKALYQPMTSRHGKQHLRFFTPLASGLPISHTYYWKLTAPPCPPPSGSLLPARSFHMRPSLRAVTLSMGWLSRCAFHTPRAFAVGWWKHGELNPEPPRYERVALPVELCFHMRRG